MVEKRGRWAAEELVCLRELTRSCNIGLEIGNLTSHARRRLREVNSYVNFSKVIFRSEVCFPGRQRLFRMTSYECIKHCGKPFGVVFFIHQAVRFTRICLQLHNLGQDKPIFFLLKPFSSNKRLFHSGGHVEFSNFADIAGTRRPFL